MKKFYTLFILLTACCTFLTANAQNQAPETIDGFVRVTNSAFLEDLTSFGSYDLGGSVPDPAKAASVVRITTGKVISFMDEMDKLDNLLAQGLITQEEYTEKFMNLMNVQSWKSSFYPITKLEIQGQEYTKFTTLLEGYADDAIEYFLNNEVSRLYTEYRDVLLFLCAVATDVIKPINIESEDAFRQWVESYLTRMRSVADFGIYLHPIYDTPDDPNQAASPTGEYYFEFKTPIYVGSMEKAQTYINSLLKDDEQHKGETLNIWDSAKEYMLMAMEKDYPADSPEYKFISLLLDGTQMNTLYIIGENEEGGLKIQQLPDSFNTQGVIVSQDDIARCTWRFNYIDNQNPLAVVSSESAKDSEGWYYTSINLPFACRNLTSGLEFYYATDVNYDTSVPTLTKIEGEIIPAAPLIVRSKSTVAADNSLLPVDEDGPATEGNVLKGSIFAIPNSGTFSMIGANDQGPVFSIYNKEIPANTAYYSESLAGVSSISSSDNAPAKVYDLFGREVKNPSAKGIYIVNGKKVVNLSK